jgi:hypothetical protein
MYTAERQRAQPYLAKVAGPLIEQWFLLHHRMVRVVTNHRKIADNVRHFLYYADFLAENIYENPVDLPIAIPENLLWQVGEGLYRPVALTCYLFETLPGEQFPPEPAEAKPDDVEWVIIPGVDGPLQARWQKEWQRFREYQAYPGVSSRICTVRDKKDLHATIFVEDVEKVVPWFMMRHVFYMVVGALLCYDGYEVVHAGAIDLDGAGILLVGSPGSGKTTLLLSCLQVGMKLLGDDVVLLAKDNGIVKVYSFPEDIGVRRGTIELLGHNSFMQRLKEDVRHKRFIDVQKYFRKQVSDSCQVSFLLFVSEEQRSGEFHAERLSPSQAISWLMSEYISRQLALEGGANDMFGIFSDLVTQAQSYRVTLTPEAQVNAEQIRLLKVQHSRP